MLLQLLWVSLFLSKTHDSSFYGRFLHQSTILWMVKVISSENYFIVLALTCYKNFWRENESKYWYLFWLQKFV